MHDLAKELTHEHPLHDKEAKTIPMMNASHTEVRDVPHELVKKYEEVYKAEVAKPVKVQQNGRIEWGSYHPVQVPLIPPPPPEVMPSRLKPQKERELRDALRKAMQVYERTTGKKFEFGFHEE